MGELLRFDDGDHELVVELGADDDAAAQQVARLGGVLVAAKTLEQAVGGMARPLRKVLAAIRQVSPDEHEIEFGLKLNGEVGAVVARSSAEGHFVVRMRWTGGRTESGSAADPGSDTDADDADSPDSPATGSGDADSAAG